MEWLALFLILAALVGFMYLAYKIGRQFEVKLANELAAEKAEVIRLRGERDAAVEGKGLAKKDLILATDKLNAVQYELDAVKVGFQAKLDSKCDELNAVKAKLDAKHDKLNAKQVEIDQLKKDLELKMNDWDISQELLRRLDADASDYRRSIREKASKLLEAIDNA